MQNRGQESESDVISVLESSSRGRCVAEAKRASALRQKTLAEARFASLCVFFVQ